MSRAEAAGIIGVFDTAAQAARVRATAKAVPTTCNKMLLLAVD